MKTDISFDVIIPVIATTAIAVMGYIVQIIALKENNKKEADSKKIEAYSGFYLDLSIILSHVILLYRDYCEKNTYMDWRAFGEVVCFSINEGEIQGDNKSIIEDVYLEAQKIISLFKHQKYYPMSKRLHKYCISLNIYCVYLETIRNNSFTDKNIELSVREIINMPNLEKMMKRIAHK